MYAISYSITRGGTRDMNRNISGTYKHYKEGKRYIAFCIANDRYMNKYVLYQQCYGTNDFWIRPYDMFFDSVKETPHNTQVKGTRFNLL